MEVLKTTREISCRNCAKRKRIVKGDTIVEATAGNTGIGLAMAANRYHLKCVIFAPEGFSEEKFQLYEYWVLKSNEHLKIRE